MRLNYAGIQCKCVVRKVFVQTVRTDRQYMRTYFGYLRSVRYILSVKLTTILHVLVGK